MKIDFNNRFKMWIEDLNPSKIVVIHIDTTGLDEEKDEILQITIINGYGEVLLDSYVKPLHRRKWENAEKMNNISPSIVFKRGVPKIEDLKPKILEILNNSEKILLYNADFVLRFLAYAIDLDVDRKFVEHECDENLLDYQNKVIDVMFLFANDYNHHRRSRLLPANNQFDFPEKDIRDHFYDVNATLWLYYSMYEDKKWKRVFELVENIEEANYELGLNNFVRVTKKDKSTYWKRRNENLPDDKLLNWQKNV